MPTRTAYQQQVFRSVKQLTELRSNRDAKKKAPQDMDKWLRVRVSGLDAPYLRVVASYPAEPKDTAMTMPFLSLNMERFQRVFDNERVLETIAMNMGIARGLEEVMADMTISDDEDVEEFEDED